MEYKNFEVKQKAEIADRIGWTWKDWHKKDSKALARMKAETPKLFSRLFLDEFGLLPKI